MVTQTQFDAALVSMSFQLTIEIIGVPDEIGEFGTYLMEDGSSHYQLEDGSGNYQEEI